MLGGLTALLTQMQPKGIGDLVVGCSRKVGLGFSDLRSHAIPKDFGEEQNGIYLLTSSKCFLKSSVSFSKVVGQII
ncbi:hypothetical protein MUO66_05465 [Candidatus Bathyarchaeota archaeon]|nr:hypothetical protein [Candidatus Bathyarchaeota archaeon]